MRMYLAFWQSKQSQAVAPAAISAIIAESNHAELLDLTVEQHVETRQEMRNVMQSYLGAPPSETEGPDATMKRLQLQVAACRNLQAQKKDENKQKKQQEQEQARQRKEELEQQKE